MTKLYLPFFLILLFILNKTPDDNSGFESADIPSALPSGWWIQAPNYNNIRLDSATKYEGKYSLSIQNSIDYNTPQEAGNYFFINQNETWGNSEGTIELRGYMKLGEVQSGYAGIWLKAEGVDGRIELLDKKYAGTHDWAEYRLSIPYSKKITQIAYGGILDGVGKVWFDNFRLYKDGKTLNNLTRIPPKKAQQDTAYLHGSGIKDIKINANNIANLAIAGQLWGFLKYHHPYAASGDVNWDAELFKIIPRTLECRNAKELSYALEDYLNTLPKVSTCTACKTPSKEKVILAADYGDLFTSKKITKSLTNKLRHIQQNSAIKQNYWVKKDPGLGYPQFVNEKSYDKMTYPDAGYRLLALFRYWSMINYYSPYRNLTASNWNQVLKDFIPQFLAAQHAMQYTLSTLKLIATIKDTHANLSDNVTLESYKGKYRVPFRADFIENKLIVSGYRTDSQSIQQRVKLGDLIESINGQSVKKLLKKYLHITPASNYQTQLRDLPWNYLTRSNQEELQFVLLRNGKRIKLTLATLKGKSSYSTSDQKEKEPYYLIRDQIGYVDAGKYQNAELPKLIKTLAKTKGIIVDLRSYPSDLMAYSFVNYFKSAKTQFAKISLVDYSHPGNFYFADSVYNEPAKNSEPYQGKVVVLVNSDTQSQGEFTAMALQSSPNVTVIGSQTAGADGEVSAIVLPGGIFTMISSRGIFYPDNTPTQGPGIKIDIVVKPTIKGIRDGKDELLDKAINLLSHN
ncbi:S41 family peptidase [Pedobacter sp. Leaf132]|uniref:S41 family peptidase n=1 Tax=Pedobacter sp. Leaf132 TaxID=2876557 RepID=UPI001E2E62E4|nr:S41 family peptidase [Pedobacter sp. Leaf132]